MKVFVFYINKKKEEEDATTTMKLTIVKNCFRLLYRNLNKFITNIQPKIKLTTTYILNNLHAYVIQKLYVLVSFHT